MRVHSPTTLDEALELLAAAAARGQPLRPVAGATDVYVDWPRQVTDDMELLDLSRLGGELGPWRLTDDALELGALTTFWDVIEAPAIAAAFPLLPAAARQIGAPQIQTRGTWAGNIGNGSPAADGVLVLMAYDAVVVLRAASGTRSVALDQYYTGYRQSVRRPDELIVGIRVPRRPREGEWCHKVGARRAQAITKVGVAVVKDAAGWRVVANSVAPCVCRCRVLEHAFAAGVRFGSPGEIARVLASDVSPIDDLRSTARYRAAVLARLLYFWLLER